MSGPWEPPAASPVQALQDELDGLLDKVSSRGLDALSSDEKKRLNEAIEAAALNAART